MMRGDSVRRRRPRSRAANIARLKHAELWEKYWRFRSVEARNVLVKVLLPQAIGFARKALIGVLRGRRSAESSIDLGLTDDEKEAVAIGLVSVVERYDPTIALLSTYMWWNVRGAVIELWRKQGWFPKRWFSKGAYELRGHRISMLSLDKIREDHNDEGYASYDDNWVPAFLVDHDSMEETKNAVSSRDECLFYLNKLSGQDRTVIRMRYVEDVSFVDIAKKLRVTRQRVCSIHRRAILKLRKLVKNI